MWQVQLERTDRSSLHCQTVSLQHLMLITILLKGGQKKDSVSSVSSPKLSEVENSFFWRGGMKKSRRFSVFHFCFSFKQSLLRSHFGSWQIFLLKVKPRLKMKCKLFQFNSSKIGHLIWEHFPVLPISLVQQTAWKWQAVPQPRGAAECLIFPQSEREWKF